MTRTLRNPIALGIAATVIAPGGIATELVYLAVGLGLALVLAYGLHRVVERPLIALGKRGAARITKRPAPAPVPLLAGA